MQLPGFGAVGVSSRSPGSEVLVVSFCGAGPRGSDLGSEGCGLEVGRRASCGRRFERVRFRLARC